MVKKKIWATGAGLLVICASLIVTCVSIHDKSLKGINSSNFSDVTDSDWFYSDVSYVDEKGLMSGTDEDVFSPNDTMTRAMVVTVLWRLEGQPIGDGVTFTDVDSDAYYHNAVAWAFANNIVSGYDENTFGPNDDVTREQLAAILYRYADNAGYEISKTDQLDSYKDKADISDYAKIPLGWANANGIINGTSDDMISPKGNALRCQVAAILRRFCDIYGEDIERSNEGTIKTENELQSNGVKDSTVSNSGKTAGSNKDSSEVEKNETPIVTISEATALPGENVIITAKIKNNPGILGMTLTLDFDETCFTLEKAESGDAVNGVLDFTASKSLGSGSKFVWDGIDITDDMVKDGEILKMSFHVSDNAAIGKYPITLSYAAGDIVDNALASVEPSIKTGYITINN